MRRWGASRYTTAPPFVEGNTEILRRARGAEAVIVNKTPLSAETIGALLPELRYIGVLATGFNVVDIAAAKAAGIPVCNIPTYGTTAVAQFAMALLLELCHHVADHSRSVKAGDWSRCPDFCYWNTPLIELAGKTFGVIGYGRIGQATARLAAAFGMEVLACDAYAKPCPPARLTTLEEVLEKSDVISLHCPLTPETQGIINRETLDRMKDGVFLLNTSRGAAGGRGRARRRPRRRQGCGRRTGCAGRGAASCGQPAHGLAKLPHYAAYRLGAQREPPAADGRGRGKSQGMAERRTSERGESINGYEKGPHPFPGGRGGARPLQVADKVWGLPGCSIIRAALTVARMVSLPRCKSLWVFGPTAHRAGASLRATGPALPSETVRASRRAAAHTLPARR